MKFENSNEKASKRIMLLDASKLYDAFGWLSLTILAKIEFQNLWFLGIYWNKLFSDDLNKRWLQYGNILIDLKI